MRKLKVGLAGIVFLFLPGSLWAQIDKEMNEFNEFVKQQQQEFESFVDQQNREFANFLKENWIEYNQEPAVVRPKRPEPVKPVVFNKNIPVMKPREIKVDEVTPVKAPSTRPVPVIKPDASKKPVVAGREPTKEPVKKPTPVPGRKPQNKPVEQDPFAQDPFEQDPIAQTPVDKPEVTQPEREPVTRPTRPATPPVATRTGMKFDFYGETCVVNDKLKNRLSLNGIAEKDIARGWEVLSGIEYQPLVNDCQATKNELSLNDWGYLLLTEKIAKQLCATNNSNEVALMQMFILCQSGYKAKVVRAGNRLVLFFGSDELIYGKNFLTIGGVKYYRYDVPGGAKESLYTYNRDFSTSSKLVCMNIGNEQLFKGQQKRRTLRAKAYPGLVIESIVNDGLISFYKDYPQCEFSVYVGAPVSLEIQQSVLPALQQAIQGKKQQDAANLLINFVQTAFEYQTDDQQFGYEKPFFVDELFYYPYSDCEDRAVLYSYLVRTLMGLDVVLLNYPGHLATAVRFTDDISGDYLKVAGEKYVICDPTYIGANIGCAMPQFREVAAKVLKYE